MASPKDGRIEEYVVWLAWIKDGLSDIEDKASCDEMRDAFRSLRAERYQLAARVEELEDQNRQLSAALDGTMTGPEAA